MSPFALSLSRRYRCGVSAAVNRFAHDALDGTRATAALHAAAKATVDEPRIQRLRSNSRHGYTADIAVG